jgi:hypothetical protein
MAVAARQILDPREVLELETVTKAKIQSLVDHELLRSKVEVEWKAPTGEAFPTEDDKEQVVFVSFFERRFNTPTGTSSEFFFSTTSWS